MSTPTFNYRDFVTANSAYAKRHGFNLAHFAEDKENSISEHIGGYTRTRSFVIAITDHNGNWYPVAPSSTKPASDPMNRLRRHAYTLITGRIYVG